MLIDIGNETCLTNVNNNKTSFTIDNTLMSPCQTYSSMKRHSYQPHKNKSAVSSQSWHPYDEIVYSIAGITCILIFNVVITN